MSQVADDFYLIAHDPTSGRCRISPRATGLGLAAGLLVELVLGGHLRVVDEGLGPGPARHLPSDRMLLETRSRVLALGSQRDVAAWLACLAADATDGVRGRLILDGTLRVAAVRTPMRRRRVQLPSNAQAAAWPAIRLAVHLSQAMPLTLPDQVLTALADVTGLLDVLAKARPSHRSGWERAVQVQRGLPADLALLVADTKTALDRGRARRSWQHMTFSTTPSRAPLCTCLDRRRPLHSCGLLPQSGTR